MVTGTNTATRTIMKKQSLSFQKVAGRTRKLKLWFYERMHKFLDETNF